MQCNVSNRPDDFLNNFYSFNHYSTKIQTNLTNIMENHQLNFQLDVLTFHEGIKVLLESDTYQPFSIHIFPDNFPIFQRILM